MAAEKDIDISGVKFVSAAFPTEADMKLWDSLTQQQQRAALMRDEEAGFNSGVAPEETLEARLARMRAKADAL